MIEAEKNEPTKEPLSSRVAGGTGTASGTPKGMKYIFGIFMIIIYLGMGYLMFVNFFDWTEDFAWARYSLGTLFILYGFWRGYRQFKGMY
jgi:hypothetical protein